MISSFSELKSKSKSKDTETDKIGRTVIVRNFQDGTSLDELEVKFREFGLVNKVTLMCDKLTGKPKT